MNATTNTKGNPMRSRPTVAVDTVATITEPVTTSRTATIELSNPELTAFIEAEAARLGVPFETALGYTLAKGVAMIRNTRNLMNKNTGV